MLMATGARFPGLEHLAEHAFLSVFLAWFIVAMKNLIARAADYLLAFAASCSQKGFVSVHDPIVRADDHDVFMHVK